jgi:hypothetical protein
MPTTTTEPASQHPVISRAPADWHVPVGAMILVALALALLLMGREPICKCGFVKLWHGAVMSAENSQHLADWYTPSHVIHGVIFYALLYIAFPKVPVAARLVAAIGIESLWEFVENTPATIERYRAATISLDYYGDSVVNSLADTAAMAFGFFLAHRLPILISAVGVVVLEVLTAWIIRDNLTLNVLMLIYPIEAIKSWQAAL